ncbi:MAG: MoaD/ThiS family protein [Chloroflexi bacterium]|nr:MoaD/ThiS family protein [Chloroflexota bacterium]
MLHSITVIQVRMYNLLAERSLSGKERYEVEFTDGMIAADIIHKEGFFGDEEATILVLLNDEQATRQTALADGDRVEFMINMVGG